MDRSSLGHLICNFQTLNRLYHCMTLFYDDDVARKTRIRILDEAVYRDSLSFFRPGFEACMHSFNCCFISPVSVSLEETDSIATCYLLFLFVVPVVRPNPVVAGKRQQTDLIGCSCTCILANAASYGLVGSTFSPLICRSQTLAEDKQGANMFILTIHMKLHWLHGTRTLCKQCRWES